MVREYLRLFFFFEKKTWKLTDISTEHHHAVLFHIPDATMGSGLGETTETAIKWVPILAQHRQLMRLTCTAQTANETDMHSTDS